MLGFFFFFVSYPIFPPPPPAPTRVDLVNTTLIEDVSTLMKTNKDRRNIVTAGLWLLHEVCTIKCSFIL